MSEAGYQEIDLDDPGKVVADPNLEIEHEEDEPGPELEAPAIVAPVERTPPPKARNEDDDDDDSNVGDEASERKRLSRSQRLKNQRDAYAAQLAETQRRLAEAESRAQRFERDASEGASIGMDFYVKSLDANIQSLRQEFDAAFEAGDRDKIFDVQTKISTLVAEREQARRDKLSIPTPAARPSGQEAPPPTRQTPPPASQPQAGSPSPAAMEWYQRNKEWFNKDPVTTAVARTIDSQMVNEGYQPSDPDYFEELDKRLHSELPHKFKTEQREERKAAPSPTVQNRSTPQPTNGKVRVIITGADREMARHLGIPIEAYAREKARREQSQNTANQYTEIL